MKTKHRIYLFLSALLGLLLSILFWAAVELKFVSWSVSQGVVVLDYWASPFVLGLIMIGGIILGSIAGVRWWQIVYVEKRHWRMRKNNI